MGQEEADIFDGTIEGDDFESEEVESEEPGEEITGEQEDEAQDEEEQADETSLEDQGSQPGKDKQPKGFIRRIQKQKAKLAGAQDELAKAREESSRKDREIELLKLEKETNAAEKSQSTNQTKGEPDPDDYDDGIYDKNYLADTRKHLTEVAKETARQEFANLTQQQTQGQKDQEKESGREEALKAHYSKAAKMGVKDYEAVDDKAWDILGHEFVSAVAENFENSHKIIYHLGANPKEAEKLLAMMKSNPIKGVAWVSKLDAKLAGSRHPEPPEPDEEYRGGRTSSKGSSFSDGATFT